MYLNKWCTCATSFQKMNLIFIKIWQIIQSMAAEAQKNKCYNLKNESLLKRVIKRKYSFMENPDSNIGPGTVTTNDQQPTTTSRLLSCAQINT